MIPIDAFLVEANAASREEARILRESAAELVLKSQKASPELKAAVLDLSKEAEYWVPLVHKTVDEIAQPWEGMFLGLFSMLVAFMATAALVVSTAKYESILDSCYNWISPIAGRLIDEFFYDVSSKTNAQRG